MEDNERDYFDYNQAQTQWGKRGGGWTVIGRRERGRPSKL